MTAEKLKRILIIEDDKIILHALKEFFESEGFNVQIAIHGLAAMEILEKTEMPHLILLDMNMPKMNGWEFAKAYYEKYSKRAPIIVSTAAVDAEQWANDISAIDFIEKPFNLDVLLQMVTKYI